MSIKRFLPKIYGTFYNSLAIFHPRLAGKLAFETFSKVRKGRILEEQEEFLRPARETIERIADHNIQTYHWEGKGPTVMLIHGWESNTHRWRNLIGFLQRAGFSIRAFDAPGHGNSSGQYLHVPLYSECLEFMVRKFNPKFIVGHSVGGMTTLYTLYRKPELPVEKVVTIGSPSEFYEIMDHFKSLLTLDQSVMQSLERYVMKKFGLTIEEFSSATFVNNSKVKGLLFHDRHDRITPYHASVSVHKHWDQSTLISTEGLGHSMHQEEVNMQIIAFLLN